MKKSLIYKLDVSLKRFGRVFTPWRVAGMLMLLLAIASFAVVLILQDRNIAVLNPKGVIAQQQFDLILFTTLLGVFVIIPVFVLLFAFARRYRADNKMAKYTPDDEGSRWLEATWWGIPVIIIGILSVVTWVSTHELDPYRKIASENEAVKVQVVALQWRWLFLYPDQGIATINELRIPKDTPIEFEIAADGPMAAFWVPNLGSQMYAMNGMSSKLSLKADTVGVYPGRNTNITGEGYAKMQFQTHVVEPEMFQSWAKQVAGIDRHLDWSMYEADIAPQSHEEKVQYYMLHDKTLYQRIIDKYMGHGGHEVTDSDKASSGSDDNNHEGHH